MADHTLTGLALAGEDSARPAGAGRRTYAVPVLLVVVFLGVATWGYRGGQVERLGPPVNPGSARDLGAFLQGARDLRNGTPLYHRARDFGRAPDFKHFVESETTLFVYPPIAGLLLQPLALMTLERATVVWAAVSHAALLLTAFLVVAFSKRVDAVNTLLRGLAVLTLFVVFYPVQLELAIGQMDILLLPLMALTIAGWMRGSPWCGVPLGIAIAIKPLLVPLGMYFLWKRAWASLVCATATTLALTVFGFWYVGWRQAFDYAEVSRLWSTGPFLVFPFNQSAKGLALRAFTDNGYIEPALVWSALAIALPVVVAVLAAWSWAWAVRPSESAVAETAPVEFGLSLTTLMLISPLAEDIHFVWLLLPLATLPWVALDRVEGPWKQAILATSVALGLYLGYPALNNKIYAGYETILAEGHPVAQAHLPLTGVYFYGLLGLHATLLVALWRLRRTEPADRR